MALAARAGVTQASVSRVERGDATHIRAETLARLARALDVTPDDLGWQRLEAIEKDQRNPKAEEMGYLFSVLAPLQRDQLLDFGRFLARKGRRPNTSEPAPPPRVRIFEK